MTFVDRFVSEDRLRLGDAGIGDDLEQARAALADPDPDVVPTLARVDLVFYNVAVSRGSYEGRVFLDNEDADAATPTDHAHGYAGSFWIFGHDSCVGGPGHCDPDWSQSEDIVDFRRPHHMLPDTVPVTITRALREIPDLGDEITLTVVAVRPGHEEGKPPLRFEHVRLLTYE